LKGTELGSTVDQAESLIKKHDAFESLLATQDAKVGYSHTLHSGIMVVLTLNY